MKILVTGGTGYIGSHTIVELINNGYQVVVYDNLCNSSPLVLDRVYKITKKKIKFIEGDICDPIKLNQVFNEEKIDIVIHFAGLKAVAESILQPLRYYENNVYGSYQLINTMKKNNVKKIIFSSSATVYGNQKTLPLKEEMTSGILINPYSKTKFIVENILEDISNSDKSWQIVILRYFNPVGAHPSGLIGENPNGIPNNLMPLITQTAIGKRKILNIFGKNFNTIDGSCVRDYIHVVDLAKGHLSSIKFCLENSGLFKFNLGTGVGRSVIEILQAFKKVNSVDVPYKIVKRRIGDVDQCYANVDLASKVLGWKAKFGLAEMCRDSWNWQLKNPDGY